MDAESTKYSPMENAAALLAFTPSMEFVDSVSGIRFMTRVLAFAESLALKTPFTTLPPELVFASLSTSSSATDLAVLVPLTPPTMQLLKLVFVIQDIYSTWDFALLPATHTSNTLMEVVDADQATISSVIPAVSVLPFRYMTPLTEYAGVHVKLMKCGIQLLESAAVPPHIT